MDFIDAPWPGSCVSWTILYTSECFLYNCHIDIDHSEKRKKIVSRENTFTLAIALVRRAWMQLDWANVHQDKATALQCIIIIFNVVSHGNQTNFQSVCIHFDRIICRNREQKKNYKGTRKYHSVKNLHANDPYTYEEKVVFQFSFELAFPSVRSVTQS